MSKDSINKALQDLSQSLKDLGMVAIPVEEWQSTKKMALIGEYASSLAHELAGPLSIIQGYYPLIASEPDPKALLDRIARAVTHCTDLLGAFKTYARNEKLDAPELVSFKSIVDTALLLAAEKAKMHRVKWEIGPIDPALELYMRPFQLVQVLLNLFSNAIDAQAQIPPQERWIKFSLTQDDAELVFVIKDNGPGLSLEAQKNILRPYFTTKAADTGTGLGLMLSQRILAEYGGQVEFVSNNPTTFKCHLPQKGEAPKVPATEGIPWKRA